MPNKKLQQALQYLGLLGTDLYDDNEQVVRSVSAEDQMFAFLSNLFIAGYLSDSLIEKCVTYLSAEKPFINHDELEIPHEQVIKDIKAARDLSYQGGVLNPQVLSQHLCEQNYYSVTDIIDILMFLSQTAFDRSFGQERDSLKTHSWMEDEQTAQLFLSNCEILGLLTPKPPQRSYYNLVVVMGCAYIRALKRIDYFCNRMRALCGEFTVVATDTRDLSVGLDGEVIMLEVANFLGIQYDEKNPFVEKEYAGVRRKVLNTVVHGERMTEKNMMQYVFTQKSGSDLTFQSVSSESQEGHWRATTASNASDIAQLVSLRLQQEPCDEFHVAVVSSQPDIIRMGESVQRVVDSKIPRKIVAIEAVGPGLDPDKQRLPEILSASAVLLSEGYLTSKESLEIFGTLRNSSCFMFRDRDGYYTSRLRAQVREGMCQTPNTLFNGTVRRVHDETSFTEEQHSNKKPK